MVAVAVGTVWKYCVLLRPENWKKLDDPIDLGGDYLALGEASRTQTCITPHRYRLQLNFWAKHLDFLTSIFFVHFVCVAKVIYSASSLAAEIDIGRGFILLFWSCSGKALVQLHRLVGLLNCHCNCIPSTLATANGGMEMATCRHTLAKSLKMEVGYSVILFCTSHSVVFSRTQLHFQRIVRLSGLQTDVIACSASASVPPNLHWAYIAVFRWCAAKTARQWSTLVNELVFGQEQCFW